jgi:hypothetical protein
LGSPYVCSWPVPTQAPVYRSELFHAAGLVLRNAYPTSRETYLHMIQGCHRLHYDYDSGSIVLYGKGCIVANDFGPTIRRRTSAP